MFRCFEWYDEPASKITYRHSKTEITTVMRLGSFFTSARLIYVAANEGYLPRAFGRLHATRGTPLNAMLLQSAATAAFIILGGGFRRLINFAVVASWA